ncbi:MAG: hypothetical protein RR547_05855 [Raoultibacter sp.]
MATTYYARTGIGIDPSNTLGLYRNPQCESYSGDGEWVHNENAAAVYIGEIDAVPVDEVTATRIMKRIDDSLQ